MLWHISFENDPWPATTTNNFIPFISQYQVTDVQYLERLSTQTRMAQHNKTFVTSETFQLGWIRTQRGMARADLPVDFKITAFQLYFQPATMVSDNILNGLWNILRQLLGEPPVPAV